MLSSRSIHWNLTKFLCVALPEKEGLGQAVSTDLLRTVSYLHQVQSDSVLTNQQIPSVTSYSLGAGVYKALLFVQLFSRLDASLFMNHWIKPTRSFQDL